MKKVKYKLKNKKWPLFFILMSFIIPISMGHYVYKHNYLFELGDVSHGKILHSKIYIEAEKTRFYKWTILKIGNDKNSYDNLKKKQLLYNMQFLLIKEKQKIDIKYINIQNIIVKNNKINKNILKYNSYLIIDPNSNIMMHYNSSTNLKHIISDIKRLLKYARF